MAALVLVVAALLVAATAIGEEEMIEKNYWRVDGDRMRFRSAELTMDARLPAGFVSLKVLGHEFLAPGCGMTWRPRRNTARGSRPPWST